MSNHGHLNRDGIFANIQIGSKPVIDKNGNGTFNTLKIQGRGEVATEWKASTLPDIDQTAWAPVHKTRYFQTALTATRHLTISQASMNAAYPDAAEQTLIEFEFPLSDKEDVTLHVEDLEGVYLNNNMNPARTFDNIQHMKDGYVVKESGDWLICLPDIRYD